MITATESHNFRARVVGAGAPCSPRPEPAATDAQIAEWVRRAATLTDAQIDAIILAAAREARAVAALASEIEAAAGEMTRGEA